MTRAKTRLISWLVPLAAAALLGACASGVRLDEPAPVDSRITAKPQEPSRAADDAQAGARAAASRVASVDVREPSPSAALSFPRVVYFDFNSFVIKDEAKPVVEENAKWLVASRKRHVVVEGHTDERGGREYNVALGQRRAEAVVKSLELLGVNASQLEAVSFGKERPAAQGSDEAAWALNRRAELVNR